MNQRAKSVFFASQNTCEGFCSYFDRIFSEESLRALYIIKGGPGTGKSHLMKRIAEAWGHGGDRMERFLCSSDPDSLDGVLNLSKGIAVIDGTAPHTADPKYPGCVGRILYTGSYWDPQKLSQRREEILSLAEKKSKHTAAAYAYLRAAGQLENGCRTLALTNFNKEKLQAAAKRFAAKELNAKGDGKRQIRITSGFNQRGLTRLRTLEALADRRCLVCEKYSTGHLFLEELLSLTSLPAYCSYSPMFPHQLDGLFFPDKSLAVVCDKKDEFESLYSQADRYVNMERFLDMDALRDNRQKLRFGSKCRDTLFKGAKDAFQKAAQEHRRLEEIYVEAMDFGAFSAWERGILKELS